MQPQPKSELQAPLPVRPVMIEAESLFDRWNEITRLIADRAYKLFDRRGREDGRAFEDWLRAESEVLRPVAIEITESDDVVAVRAEMPGFTADEIKLSLGPRRLIINSRTEKTDEQNTEDTFYEEQITDEIFRMMDLPAEVDPAKATATYEGGILSLVLPKAGTGEPSHANAKAG